MHEETLAHESFQSAAEHATRRVPVAGPDAEVSALLSSLGGQSFESAAHVVVCDGERFVGIARIEALLSAPGRARVREVMDAKPPVVAPGADQEIAAWRAAQRGESALAVVDAEGRFRGVIPPHRLVHLLLSEHEEDLERLGGILVRTRNARETSEEPVPKRFRHRMPWLLVGLLGALAAADLVAAFEAALERTVALAFFLPGIVYLADAVGTQTETIVVRGLSVGVRLRRMLARELATGLAIGTTLAVASLPLLWLRWQDAHLALGVALALLAAASTATVTAMVLPWGMQRAGVDPAFGSGPLATVIQDLLSILLFFAIAGTIAAAG